MSEAVTPVIGDKIKYIKLYTNTYSFIFARASLNLTIASSCLTVIGIAAASPVSFACCLISYRMHHNDEVNLDTKPPIEANVWEGNSDGYSEITSHIKNLFEHHLKTNGLPWTKYSFDIWVKLHAYLSDFDVIILQ